MKYLYIAILAGFLAGSTCLATEYRFTFHVPDNGKMSVLKYRTEAKNRYDALQKAGLFCGDFFGIGTRNLSDTQIDDIIDACANPSID